jgi:glycosyltransferase involved in cell wall biosynthesis
MQPTVTVVLTTYNHERFIAQAVRSVLDQRTGFGVELVVLDDCSTDGTQEILRAFARAHPDRIRLVLSPENKCDNEQFMAALLSARGRYVALLDGDDYWTSPDKLQRQVDFLDAHPECALCFHNVSLVSDPPTTPGRTSLPPTFPARSTLRELLDHCFITTCSVLLRTNAVNAFPAWYPSDNCADWTLFVLAAQHGELGYLDDVMAVYRQHTGGFWTGCTIPEQRRRVIQFYEQLMPMLAEPYLGVARTRAAKECFELSWDERHLGHDMESRRALAKCRQLESDLRKVAWELRAVEGNLARLTFPDDGSGVRVDIDRIGSREPFDLQINLPHLTVNANERYSVSCRGRADSARTAFLGFARARAPWSGLGLHREIGLDEQWREFCLEFVASDTELDGRIHFDLGGDPASVEVADVRLEPHSEGRMSRAGASAVTP